MKNSIVFLFTVFLAITHSHYAQGTVPIDSKEEAIAILKANNFMEILRNPTDTLTNIDRFIKEIDKIIPINQEKISILKTQILPALQNRDRDSQYWSLLFWPWHAGSLHVGLNVNHILKSNFSITDYEKISEQLSCNLTKTNEAYLYLARVRNKELTGEESPLITPGSRESLENVYSYFGI